MLKKQLTNEVLRSTTAQWTMERATVKKFSSEQRGGARVTPAYTAQQLIDMKAGVKRHEETMGTDYR